MNDNYGNSYTDGLQIAAEKYAPDMKLVLFDFPWDADQDTIKRLMSNLKDTGYRYFFGILFDDPHYVPFMEEAYRQGELVSRLV